MTELFASLLPWTTSRDELLEPEGGGRLGEGDRKSRIVETHISVLLFIGARVYKLRKPVTFDFVDFSTRAARERDCRREVELNARFARDVYLGVIDLCADGVPIDHLVVMRRLPEGRRLSVLLRHADARRSVRAVARLLADLDGYSLRSPEIDACATAEAITSAWRQNFSEVEPFAGAVLDPKVEARIQLLVDRFLCGRAPLFESRIAAGRVRDGHGDLQAEDVFMLDDGPRILDCVEFDDRLRYGDVLADLAFLAMDLERLGAPELSTQLLSDFQELSGDAFPRALAYHYCASRAYVRAKVACLAADEGVAGATDAANDRHRLALSFLERARVRLVLIGGIPGSGKSTLARAIGDELDLVVLRSDEVRHEFAANLSPADRYDKAATDATYEKLIERARIALAQGESVVLDASWTDDAHRQLARALASASASELVEIRCALPVELAARRVTDRGEDASEATAAVARALAVRADPWPEATVVDTAGTVANSLARVRALLE